MFFFYFIAIFTNVMEIQIRQGITIIVPECRDAAITCWVNEDTDTLMQLKIANFYSVAWPAYFTSIRLCCMGDDDDDVGVKKSIVLYTYNQ